MLFARSVRPPIHSLRPLQPTQQYSSSYALRLHSTRRSVSSTPRPSSPPPAQDPRPRRRSSMPDHISLTFLGTAAGRPCESRNVSSLALKLDSRIWVVDAGEGTQHQFMKSNLKMSAVWKIFVTHMHGDHINGLAGLLCTISAGEGGVLPGMIDPRTKMPAAAPATEIYGPSGLREFLRVNLRLTQSILTRPYVVHELLFDGEEADTTTNLHESERSGSNIRQSSGIWKDFVTSEGIQVSAGPILHTINCLGYIFHELPRPLPLDLPSLLPHLQSPSNVAALLSQGIRNPLSLLSTLTSKRLPLTLPDGTILHPPPLGGPGRKIVVLGDTYDASGCAGLAEGADLLVHESTNAFLPTLDESQGPAKGATAESVREKAKEHGHSTPEVAGEFVRRVGAKRLVMNHLSIKYPDVGEWKEGDSEGVGRKRAMLREIERLASEVSGVEAVVATDFLEIEVPKRKVVIVQEGEELGIAI